MNTPKRLPTKAVEYPDETEGGRLAAKARQAVGRMSAEEQEALIRRGLTRVYGGKPHTPAVAGH